MAMYKIEIPDYENLNIENIDKETYSFLSIKNDREELHRDDILCTYLYDFLRKYVPTRLKYEGRAEREDCIQDTIMFMLDRYHKLTEEEKKDLDLGKFFYNRARSHISFYIRKLQEYRESLKELYTYEMFKKEIESLKEDEFIDYDLIDRISSKYRLDKKRQNLFKKLVINKLVRFGDYVDPIKDIDEEEISKYDPNDVLDALSYAAVDEYLIKAVECRGDEYK